MDAGVNFLGLEKFLQVVTFFAPNDIHVIHRRGPFAHGRRLHHALEPFGVARSNLAAIFVEPVEMLQHHAPDGGIDFVEPHVVTGKFVVVLALATVVAQHPQAFGHLRVVRGDATAVAEHGQVFRREEAERAEVAHRADGLALVFRTLRLRTIFDDPEMMFGGDAQQPVHVHGMPVNIHRDDADGARRDGGFDLVEIQAIGVVDVHEHRAGAEVNERFHGGKRGVAGHDDFIAGADALQLVQEINNHRPGRTQNALGGAGVGREFFFKLLRFLAEDVLAGADGAQGGFLDFGIHETFG